MVTRVDSARLALLIAYYEATKGFTDQGAVALLRWYEGFCASQGENTTEPLDLSGTGISTLSELITLPISFGVPYIKLANNPDLTDITALQEMPILAKLGTLEHALDREQSPYLVKALGEIRTALLESKTKIKLSLEGLDSIPVYLQLLSDVEDLALFFAEKITSLIIVSSLKKLNRLDLDGFHNLLNLKTLTDLPSLKILEIRHASSGNILEGVERFPSLEIIEISNADVDNIQPLEKLPNLVKLALYGLPRSVNRILENNLPALQELSFFRLYDLRALSIGQSLPLLRSLIIVDGSLLTSITGLHYLPHLEKLTIRQADNLNKLEGIEEAKVY